MKVGTIDLNVDDYKLLKTERQAQQFESGL